MQVLILSWEFPPRVVGEMASYVNTLAIELVKKGVETYVISFHDSWVGMHHGTDGVKAYRVTNPVTTHLNILTWDLTLNCAFLKAASEIYHQSGTSIDVIDAHEWLSVAAGVALKKAFNTPLVFTVHSLEDHRSHYASTPLNIGIKSLEWLGAYEAERIVVRTPWMKNELTRIYNVPNDKVAIASSHHPNWVDEMVELYTDARNRLGRSIG